MNTATESRVDNYLSVLRNHLPGLSIAEREEIVREISVHIRESAEEPSSSIDEILLRLGAPEKLASQYSEDAFIQRAGRSLSPVLILQGTLRLAKRGAEGVALFMGTFIGYALGLGFLLTALLKPFFPRQTGLWIGHGVFDFGFRGAGPSSGAHELLGWWYVPVALALGLLFAWLTTFAIRKILRRSRGHAPLPLAAGYGL